MPISDLSTQDIVCSEQGASLQYAARLMKKHHVGAIVVIESNGTERPVGVLTDRDIVLSIVAEGLPFTTRVDKIMSKHVVTALPTDGIADVVNQMQNEGVRRVVLVDEDGNVCGLVSSDDILQLIAQELNGIGKLVDRQSETERFQRQRQSEMLF